MAKPGRIGVSVLPQISGFVLTYLAKNSFFQKNLLNKSSLKKIHSTLTGYMRQKKFFHSYLPYIFLLTLKKH